MYAKHLVIDQCGYWQVIEEIGKKRPHGRTSIFLLALGVEAIYLSGLPRLMIASQQVEAEWITKLQ